MPPPRRVLPASFRRSKEHDGRYRRSSAGTVNGTGVAFDVDEHHLLTVRDGKVVRFEAYIGTPAMLSALGRDG